MNFIRKHKCNSKKCVKMCNVKIIRIETLYAKIMKTCLPLSLMPKLKILRRTGKCLRMTGTSCKKK